MRVVEVDAATTGELRRSVLRPTWAPGTPMPGDIDDAVHLAAFDGDDLVGTCLLLSNPCPHHAEVTDAWQLRGMATADGRRGEGIGAAVLDGAFAAAASRGATLVWCKARVTAMRFYLAHGFTIDGEVYLEPETGVDHQDMSRVL